MSEPAARIIFYIYAFILGAAAASFVNVVAYRLPREMSFVKGRSMCPQCGHTLGALDLVPVFSWLLLGGRCRYCGAKISPRYAVVEVVGGLLSLASAYVCGLSWKLMFYFIFIFVIMTITLVDIDTMEIPNGLILALIVPALGMAFCGGASWVERIIGFFAISLPMLLLTLAIPDAFGGGDIKLSAVCGFALGWKLALVGAFIAIVFGGGFGVYLLAAKKKGRREHFAFGPFLALGFVASLLCGDALLGWYLALF